MARWITQAAVHEFQLFSLAMFINSGLAVALMYCFYYLFVKVSYNAGIGLGIAVAFLVEGGILLVSLRTYGYFSVFKNWYISLCLLFFAFNILIMGVAGNYGTYEHTTFHHNISVVQIWDHPNTWAFWFSDGAIMSNYAKCGYIKHDAKKRRTDFRYAAVAPLAKAAEGFNISDRIPAFALTWHVEKPCTVLPSAEWNWHWHQGIWVSSAYHVDEFIMEAFGNYNLSKFSAQNVVIWGDAEKPLRTARIIFYVGIGVSYFVYIFVYIFAIIRAFVNQKKYSKEGKDEEGGEEDEVSDEDISDECISSEE
eukprot:Phypoly_transcript_12974.p1 GENE.Phypoly_transcript_12974~~Phypoly_transcript_12974.p1  ORF type:complete len:309 (+),score=51.56 Phypoly_transcript_12974:83-1009(+)